MGAGAGRPFAAGEAAKPDRLNVELAGLYVGAWLGEPSMAMMLFPPSAVTLFRTCILKYALCSSRIEAVAENMRSGFSVTVSSIALGQKTRASPVLRLTISRKISRPDSFFFSPRLVPARCFRSVWYHAGELKRCTMVILQRSSRRGERVGSCVAMTTRVARWRCCAIIEVSCSVNLRASLDSVRNLTCLSILVYE